MTTMLGSPAPVATTRLRMTAYCLLLTAAAFIQEPGRIVADTKWDLAEDPWGFMGRALHLWDPLGAFGQVQNQAYGYFWPMGPFFAVGDLLQLPPWVTQRLWWSLILCVAFVGMVKLSSALGLGVPWSRVLAGFGFALSVHSLTLLGPTSIEAWPSAVAPWVLLPLVHGARGGSPRRAGVLAALAVACCGGVNAAATIAVLPLGLLWIATRTGGRRRRALLGWWVVGTGLATLWWTVPLVLLGKYSPAFLDYIENAPITTLTTGLSDVLGGSSDWVAYVSASDWRAGNALATTPFLLLDAAAIAALGLAGICRRDNPHARFLMYSVLTGVLLVSFGYAGELHGWWAAGRQDALDAVLAPLRNLHKFDVVLRLPLLLGVAHLLARVSAIKGTERDRVLRISLVGAAVIAIVGLSTPVIAGQLAPKGSFEAVPDYWREAAQFIEESNPSGRALGLPAAAFGDYRWGSTHDDVLQPLLTTPYGVRNVIPLSQPGNIRFLDAVTEIVESGVPEDRLAVFLAANGVSTLVIRNDLDAARTGAPSGVVLHQVLDRSPGITKVAEFGPEVSPSGADVDDAADKLVNRGRDQSFSAVEVYHVDGGSLVSAWSADTVPVVAGDPSSALSLIRPSVDGTGGQVPMVLAGDAPTEPALGPQVLTDGLARRELSFAAVRDNESATLGREDPYTRRSVEPNYRLYDDQVRFESVVEWRGVSGVTASSSQADAAAVGSINPARHTGAALDGDRDTWWQSTGYGGAVGQWWQVDFEEPIAPSSVDITMGPAVGPRATSLQLSTEAGEVEVEAPEPGETATFDLPEGSTDHLRITVDDVAGRTDGAQATLAEVAIPGVDAQRLIAVSSEGLSGAPDAIVLGQGRDRVRPACALVDGHYTCDDVWVTTNEDGSVLARAVTLPEAASYWSVLTVSTVRDGGRSPLLHDTFPLRVEASSSLSRDLKASAWAAVDSDDSTTWVADVESDPPTFELTWDGDTEVDSIALTVAKGAAASTPTELELRSGSQLRRVQLGEDGRATFKPMTVDQVQITIVGAEPRYSFEAGKDVLLPVGITQVSLPGSSAPVIDPDEQFDFGCGSGPALSFGADDEQTALTASLHELMTAPTLPVAVCALSPIDLLAGSSDIVATASSLVGPDLLRMTNSGIPAFETPTQIATATKAWHSTDRAVGVAQRDAPALLVIEQNFNEGWTASIGDAHLDPIRIDGWKQGWVVPAGPDAQVSMVFEPDAWYRAGLAVGVVALLACVALGLVRPRRAPAPALGSAPPAPLVDAAISVAVLGLLGGWVGLVLGCVAFAVRWFARLDWSTAGLAAALLIVAASVVQALQRTPTNVGNSWWAQLLALAALAVGVAAVGANRPTFFNFKNGRSRK